MHDLENHLPPPLMKGENFEAASWKVRNKEFSAHGIRVVIKDGLSLSMQDELEDIQEDYCSLTHEYWCDLLSTVKVKDNRKREGTQIKKIATSRTASHSDSNESVRVTRNNKARTCVGLKQQGENIPKHHCAQRYCIICKKAGINEQKYM